MFTATNLTKLILKSGKMSRKDMSLIFGPLILIGLSKERPILDHHPKAHIHEIRRISCEIHPQPYKIRCFNKNSSAWGGGCMEGAMTPDFMKSRVIAPLLHSSNWIVLVETPAFTRFWVDFTWNLLDFTWNLPDFMRISCKIERPTCKEL